MIQYYLFANIVIVFIALLYSTITDLKYREVPNYISLGLLIYGTIANSIFFFLTKNYLSTIYFLLFVLLAFLICYLFWKLGIFAGGDAKLYSGIASVMPVLYYSIFNFGFSYQMPFVLSLFILSILLMFPIVVFRVLLVYFRKTDIKAKIKISLKNNFSKFVFNILYVVSLYFIFSFFEVPFWLFIIFSILLGFVPKKIRYPISLLLFLISIIVNVNETVIIMLVAILTSVLLAILINLYLLSRSGILNYFKNVKDLKEGDLLAYPIIKDKNNKYEELKYNFYSEFKTAFKLMLSGNSLELKELFKRRKLMQSKIIINNNLACGLTKLEIKKLQNNFSGKIELKETTALVPSIFLAFVILVCFGDIIWCLISMIL